MLIRTLTGHRAADIACNRSSVLICTHSVTLSQQPALLCTMRTCASTYLPAYVPTCLPPSSAAPSTLMWRRGLLSDEVYAGDLAFGALLKQYTPWVHDGYLTYGRYVCGVKRVTSPSARACCCQRCGSDGCCMRSGSECSTRERQE
jgi:hypothetical protein